MDITFGLISAIILYSLIYWLWWELRPRKEDPVAVPCLGYVDYPEEDYVVWDKDHQVIWRGKCSGCYKMIKATVNNEN